MLQKKSSSSWLLAISELLFRTLIAIWSVLFIHLVVTRPDFLSIKGAPLGFFLLLLNICRLENWEFHKQDAAKGK